jgi:hypothetical protein
MTIFGPKTHRFGQLDLVGGAVAAEDLQLVLFALPDVI